MRYGFISSGNLNSNKFITQEMSQRATVSNITNGSNSAAAITLEESIAREYSLAAAFHDHISCTKTSEICSFVDPRNERMTLPCEIDHIYANCSDIKGQITPREDEPAQRLKEMLLFQLDLIQHQQEQLFKKDQQMSAIKQENESLKSRLERIERRMSLWKQKRGENTDTESVEGISVISKTSDCLSNLSPVSSSLNENIKGTCGRDQTKTYSKRGRKRKYPIQPQTNSTKKITSSQSSLMKDINLNQETKASSASENVSGISVTVSSPSSSSFHKKSIPSSVSIKIQGRVYSNRSNKRESILRTSDLYYLPIGETSPKAVSQTSVSQQEINVPKWKYHPLPSAYQMEGTEDIEDETFNKRHYKLEQDEKRRKKWDIQRIREMRMTEKLRKRYEEKKEAKKLKRNAEIKSFYPEPKDVQYIELCEKVPVVVFGKPVPSFKASEFSLPWLNNKEAPKSEPQRIYKKHKGYYRKKQKT
ncbi:male-specific lethal 1 isoform X1 [Tachypleus tridentatus]|uniref:male-specific lethal 1 isoform X1 n=2 Tax=Tachypleus tridentatus TaxID=6853 RepID=UPI003FD566CE